MGEGVGGEEVQKVFQSKREMERRRGGGRERKPGTKTGELGITDAEHRKVRPLPSLFRLC